MNKVSLALVVLFSLATIHTSEAQSIFNVGTSAFTKEAFSCRTHPGGQDIIISKRGKTKTVSKSAAKNSLDKSLSKISGIIISAKDIVRQRKQRLAKLLKSPTIVLPSVLDEIKSLRDDLIPKSEARVASLLAMKSELRFLKTKIKDCGSLNVASDGNTLFNASANAPISGTQWYLLAARHVFSFAGPIPREICVELNGKKTLTTWSQSVCCTVYEGPGTTNPFNICANTGLRSDQGMIGLGSICDKFSRGLFDDHQATVSSGLSSQVKVYLPTNGRC